MHTHFSADSEEVARNHVLEALEHGLDEICFTDHRDFDYPGMPFELDVPAYFEEILSLKSEFAHKITIKVGLEIGLDMNCVQEINDFVTQAPFDFVIGSVHVINHQEFCANDDFFIGKSKQEAYQSYLEANLECVREFDCFDCLGHMDYIVRYAPYQDKFLEPSAFQQTIGEILKVLVEKNIALEVNTRLFDQPQTEYFYRNLLLEYRKLGGKLVTLGTDSHRAQRNWMSYERAIDLIKSVGFDELTLLKH
jgi:histidinol-phosphatase (PHP family)